MSRFQSKIDPVTGKKVWTDSVENDIEDEENSNDEAEGYSENSDDNPVEIEELSNPASKWYIKTEKKEAKKEVLVEEVDEFNEDEWIAQAVDIKDVLFDEQEIAQPKTSPKTKKPTIIVIGEANDSFVGTTQDFKNLSSIYSYEDLKDKFPFNKLLKDITLKYETLPIEKINQMIVQLTECYELYSSILDNPEASEFHTQNREYLVEVKVILDQLQYLRDSYS